MLPIIKSTQGKHRQENTDSRGKDLLSIIGTRKLGHRDAAHSFLGCGAGSMWGDMYVYYILLFMVTHFAATVALSYSFFSAS